MAVTHHLDNPGAKGVSFYSPAQDVPAGTAVSPQAGNAPIPKLFQPLTIRGVTFPNRIWLAPMAQYSADPANGTVTPWHMAHLGGIIMRGAGLTMTEGISVTPNGRTSPQDPGIWSDEQIAPLARLVEFAHSQNQKIGIQLAHGGRKASTVAPWLAAAELIPDDLGGWSSQVVGPSPVSYPHLAEPRALTIDQIKEIKTAYVAAMQRAVRAGFDVIEIHAGHGYLLSSFHSPASNHRSDEYGGNFENRTRLTREIVQLTRASMPETMPLFLRVNGTDWLEEELSLPGSWRVEDTARLAPILADLGVDLYDISSGGLHPLQKVRGGPAYQTPFAQAAKSAVGDRMLVSTVGNITHGHQANELLEGGLDVIFAGRPFLKNPGLVWSWADDLGVQVRWANQIRWTVEGRTKRVRKDPIPEAE
ncbi:uncharacterized protein PV07_12523 [Cladophialophora immunda]|uniref:NADH:flavin oxidoreductase/NADH oxidase N-terminal domain-containing protein n=1 Tax=Cladophialophora immunda TaxID=569365 RepID=A0A0D2ABH7_9EURO|nr:uncharacterized protein PV07_12523 [Cladophialophora immunda]KIW22107.1 hypothetical protein PV07_12523 [Cladophialophora immunda]OQV11139.1 hypothetical protein CLAIMM_15025 [Cladophialophora immunda]